MLASTPQAIKVKRVSWQIVTNSYSLKAEHSLNLYQQNQQKLILDHNMPICVHENLCAKSNTSKHIKGDRTKLIMNQVSTISNWNEGE